MSLAFLDIKLYSQTLPLLQQCGKLCKWNGMESVKTKPWTYRNLVFERCDGERRHYSMNCIKVTIGKNTFIPHIIYKNEFWMN